MSKSVQIDAETIKKALESNPTSLTGLWKALGGSGSVSGSASKRMRNEFPGLEAVLAENKGKTAKAEGSEETTATKPAKRAEKKPSKSSKSAVPHDSRNPFRKSDSGYGLLVDLIAAAGSKGIGKEDLLKAYGKISGKDLTHAKYDLAVVTSAAVGRTRHRSMKDGVTIILDGANYQVRFP